MEFEMEHEAQPVSDWEAQRAAMIAAEKEEIGVVEEAAAEPPAAAGEATPQLPLEDANAPPRTLRQIIEHHRKCNERFKTLGATPHDLMKIFSRNTRHITDNIDKCSDQVLRSVLYMCTGKACFADVPPHMQISKFQGRQVSSELYNKFGTTPIPYRPAIMSSISKTAPFRPAVMSGTVTEPVLSGKRDTSKNDVFNSCHERTVKFMPKGVPGGQPYVHTGVTRPKPSPIKLPFLPPAATATETAKSYQPKKVELMEHVRAFADTLKFDVIVRGCDQATPLKASEKSRDLWLLKSEHDDTLRYPVAAIADADAEIIKGWYDRCDIGFSIQKTPTTLELDGIDIAKTAPLNTLLSGEKGLTQREIPLFIAGLPEIVSHCKQERKMAECRGCNTLSSLDSQPSHRVKNVCGSTADKFFKIAPANVLLATAERNLAATIATIDEQNDTVFHTMYALDCDARAKQTATFLKTLKTYNQTTYDKIVSMFDDMSALDVDLWKTHIDGEPYILSVTPAITYRMRKLRETCDQIAKYDRATLVRYNLDGLIEGDDWRKADELDTSEQNVAWHEKIRAISLQDQKQQQCYMWVHGYMSPFQTSSKLDKAPRDCEHPCGRLAGRDSLKEAHPARQPMPWEAHVRANKGGLFAPATSDIDDALTTVIKSLFDDNYVSISATSKTTALLRKSADSPKTLTANLEAADKAAIASDKKPAHGGFAYVSSKEFGGLDMDMGALLAGAGEPIPNGEGCYHSIGLPQSATDAFAPPSIEMKDDDDYHTAFETTQCAPLRSPSMACPPKGGTPCPAAYPAVFDNLTQQNYPTLYDQLITDTRLTNAYPHLATSKTRIFNEKMGMETAKATHVVMVMIHRATLSTVVETIELPTGNLKELVDISRAGGLARFAAPEYGFRKLFFYRTTDDAIVAAIRTRFDGVAHFSDADIDRAMREVLHVIDIQIHTAALATAAADAAASDNTADKMRAMVRNYSATAFDKAVMCSTLKSVASGAQNLTCALLLGLYRGNYKTDTATNTVTVAVNDLFDDYLRSLCKSRPQNYLSVKKELVAAFVAVGWQHDAVAKTIAMTMTAEDMDTARVSSSACGRSEQFSGFNRYTYDPNIPLAKFEDAIAIVRGPPAQNMMNDIMRGQSASWSDSNADALTRYTLL